MSIVLTVVTNGLKRGRSKEKKNLKSWCDGQARTSRSVRLGFNPPPIQKWSHSPLNLLADGSGELRIPLVIKKMKNNKEITVRLLVLVLVKFYYS